MTARWLPLLLLAGTLALAGCNRGERKGLFRGGAPKEQTMGDRISVLDFERSVEAEAELQDLEVVLPPAGVNPEWNQPGGSASRAMGPLAHSGVANRLFEVSIGKGSSATRRLNASPVVAANRVFTMDTEGLVRAFQADTGALVWERSLGLKEEGKDPAFGGGVSVADGRVYATTGYGFAVALDATSGAELWRAEVGTPLRAAPSVGEGRVLLMSQDSKLTALSADTGAQLWQVTATLEPAAILGPGGPAIDTGTVVAGFPSGELFALRVENGRTVWQDQLARTGRTTALGALSAIVASPVIARGRVYAVGHAGRIVAIDLATGQRAWERNLGGVHTPVVAGEFIFVVTTEAELVALTRRDGKIRWVTRLKRYDNEKKKSGVIAWAGPVLAGDRLWLVSSEGRMAEVDPRSGTILADHKLGGPAYLPPVVANMILYVLRDDGRLLAFR